MTLTLPSPSFKTNGPSRCNQHRNDPNRIHNITMKSAEKSKTRSSTGHKKICGVYAFEHIPTGMLYVGSSINCEERQRKHKCRGRHFFRRATELGWENFKFYILEKCLPENRLELERDWIVACSSVHPFGFNIQKDPTKRFGYEWTDEMRAVASAKTKAYFAENPKASILQSLKMKAFYEQNPEAREDVSAKMKAYYTDNPQLREIYGARMKTYFANPESRKAQSEKRKAYCADPEVRKAMSVRAKAQFAKNPHHGNKAVDQFSADGKFIARHISLSSAARAFGIKNGQTICTAIRRGHKCGGFIFKYASNA